MDESQTRAALLATDPHRFVALCWPHLRLYDKQSEVLISLCENVETIVHAANETGKTLTAALAVIWWFSSRTPARVITSSSSETQLKSILWTEIRSLIASSAYPLPFRVTKLHIEKLKDPHGKETEPLDYVIGHVTNEVENFQGHHLPNDQPRVLVVFDEASGVADELYDASDSWAHRKLVIGNPLSNTNFFYRLCRGGNVPDPAGEAKLLRKVIHIDGRDSPNVQIAKRWQEEKKEGAPPVLIPGVLTFAEYRRRESQWNAVKRQTRLYGHFCESDETMLLPMEWLDVAMDQNRWDNLVASERQATAMGVDVAAGGRDDSCWTVVDNSGVIEQIVQDTPNTMDICGRTIRLIQQYQLSAGAVLIDAGGGGKQIADRLREQGYGVRAVGFGEAARDRQAYKNRRAEMYGHAREFLNPNREQGAFALPPDAHELRHELAVIPLTSDSEGRLMLPPKEQRRSGPNIQKSIRQLLGRSPDRADSLVLAVAMLHRLRITRFDQPLVCSGGDCEMPEGLTPEQQLAWLGPMTPEVQEFFDDLSEPPEYLGDDD